jgi:hypothetical protein
MGEAEWGVVRERTRGGGERRKLEDLMVSPLASFSRIRGR